MSTRQEHWLKVQYLNIKFAKKMYLRPILKKSHVLYVMIIDELLCWQAYGL